MNTLKRLEGLIPAPYTPMKADGEINLFAIEKQTQFFKLNDINAAYICGSTGEGMSMTIDERMKVIQRWSEVAGNEFKVIVNVGHTCLKDCQALASFAQQCNVYGISAMPPCYYKPKTVEDLVDFYVCIASAAPNMPFYAYHTPVMSGVTFSMLEFLNLASKKIKTLVGIKYNHNDLMDYRLCNEFDNRKYEILFGVDELLVSALPYGMKAAIGSTYNYAVPIYRDIIKYYNQGDLALAAKAQSKSIELINVLLKYGILPAGKALMRVVGIDCGPPRLPIRALNEQAFTDLYKDLEKIVFFDYVSKSLKSNIQSINSAGTGKLLRRAEK
jgi:N-acetylneuraminate lyase